MKILYFVFFIGATFANEAAEPRKGRVLPVFEVVKFPNDVCVITGGSRNGTCYTAEECSNKGGTNAGSCASGFGVCCTFTLGCGSKTSENLTYFESSSTVLTGACRATICKANANICQIRLDFDTFVISGPSTAVATASIQNTLLNGQVTTAGTGLKQQDVTRCATDTFSVTNQNTIPVICGTNSGVHAYFEASDLCNQLDFQLGNSAQGITSVATRSWTIKVTQYACDYENLAPSGCTQYFYGSGATNLAKSFNHAGSKHLADQKQVICVRREANNCRICWTAAAADVDIAFKSNAKSYKVKASTCCGHGSKGVATFGYDCLMIPGARSTKSAVKPASHCGRSFGLQTASRTTKATDAPATVCSKSYPFRLIFHSNGYEVANAANLEGVGSGAGFSIRYFQTAC